MNPGAPFRTTRWSLILSTRGDSTEARRALDELCVAYWFPLFVHARQSGLSDDDARELVQGFTAQLLERGGLDGAAPEEGRFRAYLLGAMRHYSASVHRASRTARRDGGTIQSIGGAGLPIDVSDAAARYDGSRTGDLTPSEAFDRAWAEQVIAAARARLRMEYQERGKDAVFVALEDTLDGGSGTRSHEARAAEIGCTVGAVKVSAHRLRARLGELIRAEVSHTLDQADDLEDELSLLIQALRAS